MQQLTKTFCNFLQKGLEKSISIKGEIYMKNIDKDYELLIFLLKINEFNLMSTSIDIENLTSNDTGKIIFTLNKIIESIQYQPDLFQYYANTNELQLVIQFIYELTSNNLSSLDRINFDVLQYYFKICDKFNIKLISNISANKCIVDSLGNPISDINNIRIDISEVNDWMLNELNRKPTDLYQLSSRRFEELIAEILMRKGYEVELTPTTRDGGKDIYVASKNDFGSFLYIVECKKYKPTHKVGVNVLRDLYGVLSKERATYGIAVTTSYFSKPAKEFQQELQFQMSLKDFDSIKQWLCDVT